MALSKTLSDYEDIRPKLDRAVASEKGLRVTCETKGAAVHLRQRFYALRKLERTSSLDIYDVGDPRRGTSVYDDLHIVLIDNSLEIRKGEGLLVEEL